MAPRKNQIVTNWLAAYCGDESFLRPQAVAGIKSEGDIPRSDGWPLIDSEAQNEDLVHGFLPGFIDNLAPRSTEKVLTISVGNLRGTLELISERQFAVRGFLIDLSLESTFAERILSHRASEEVTKKSGIDETSNVIPSAFATDRMSSYATSFFLETKQFVAEVSVSDFATFEISGIAINLDQPDWGSGFIAEVRRFLLQITP